MNVTTYGYENPTTGDPSKGLTGWMAQLNFDITRLDGHSHNGVDSVLLAASSISPLTVVASSGSWLASSSGYVQTVSVPAGVTEFNSYEVQFYVSSDTPAVTNGNTHTNTTVDGIASVVASGITVGMIVTGSGVPVGTYVRSIVSNNQITLSQATTTTLVGTSLTFTKQNQRVYLQANRVTATTFALFCNDNTLSITCVFR